MQVCFKLVCAGQKKLFGFTSCLQSLGNCSCGFAAFSTLSLQYFLSNVLFEKVNTRFVLNEPISKGEFEII